MVKVLHKLSIHKQRNDMANFRSSAYMRDMPVQSPLSHCHFCSAMSAFGSNNPSIWGYIIEEFRIIGV